MSRVLNSRDGVRAETRQVVLTALDVLGYERPSALRRRSEGLVGLIMPELINPIFPAFAQMIEPLLAQHGFTPVLCTQTPGGISEDEYVEMLQARGVAGIIFVACLHADTAADVKRYQVLRDRKLPIICVNGFREEIDAPSVSINDALAVHEAVRHLVLMGHADIGFATGPLRFIAARDKAAAFIEATHDALGWSKEQAESKIASTIFSVEGGRTAAVQLIESGVTAIVCSSDLMALGAFRAVRRLGGTVPGTVSVIGFDDSLMVAFTDPPLTTMRQPVAAMATAAVQMLIDEIGGYPAARHNYVFDPELIVRGSTGPVATDH